MKISTFTVLLLLASATYAQESKRFDGILIGVETGAQNIFSGALIDEIDVITHENRLASEVSIRFRKQLVRERLVIGVTLRTGLIDGQMNRIYNNGFQEITISYRSNTQIGYGLLLGIALGEEKDWLLSTYLNEVNRTFDIIWTEENGTIHTQEDKNIFVRYGLSIERSISNKLSVDFNFGNIYVDFGDANTTESVSDIIELAAGVKLQF